MMENATISVVVSVYNTEPYLRTCLDSIIRQTYPALEILCVDDGSTDASPQILADYVAGDPRFRILTQANAGAGAARNTGLAHATGEYLIFLDSDDWFEPDFLEQMLRRARESGADVTICRAEEFDTETGAASPWMRRDELLPGDCFSPVQAANVLFQFVHGEAWDKLYRTGFIRDTGLRFPALKNSEDLVFVFQSLALADRIALADRVLVHYRTGRPSSVLHSRLRYPDAPYQAAALLKEGLTSRGCFETYRRSYINWAMAFLTWHVADMEDRKTQRACFHLLKTEWFDRLELRGHPAGTFDSRFLYSKYLLANYAPYPVFAGVVGIYYARTHRRDG